MANHAMNIRTARDVFSILPRDFRVRALQLQLLLVAGVVAEFFGIGLLIPLVRIMTGTETANSFLSAPVQWFLRNAGSSPALKGLLFFLIFYTFKTGFLGWMLFKQSTFAQDLAQFISGSLYQQYLQRPFLETKQENTGILLKNMIGEVHSFSGFVQSFILLCSECAVALGICLAVFWTAPAGAVFICAVVAFVVFLLVAVSRKKIKRWGLQRQYSDGERNKSALQSLAARMEIRLYGMQEKALQEFNEQNKVFYRTQKNIQFLTQVQRPLFEWIMVFTMITFCAMILFSGQSVEKTLPLSTAFLLAGVRFIPSANRIVNAMQTLRFTESAAKLVIEEYKRIQKKPQRNTTDFLQSFPEGDIRCESIAFIYKNDEHPVFTDLSLTIRRGEITGVSGPSGSGKSTLLNILAGLIRPDTGKIYIGDKDCTGKMDMLTPFIGYVPQDIFLFDDTIVANILLTGTFVNDQAWLWYVLRVACLDQWVNKLPDGLNTIVGEKGVKLSGGQKQRIGIARALYRKPRLLLLDESTSAVDELSQEQILGSIRNHSSGLTVVLSTHNLSAHKFCTELFVLSRIKD